MKMLDSDRQQVERLTDVVRPPGFAQTAQAGAPAHTPTPWTRGGWGGQCHIGHEHDGKSCVYDPVFYEWMNEISGPNREAVIGSDDDGARPEDIAFIVKAVNNHDELVTALNDARLQLEYLHFKFQPTGTGEAVLTRITEALKQAERP